MVDTSEEISVVTNAQWQVELNAALWDKSLLLELLVVLQDLRELSVLSEDLLNVVANLSVNWTAQGGEGIEC
jgi:hypothetical protein